MRIHCWVEICKIRVQQHLNQSLGNTIYIYMMQLVIWVASFRRLLLTRTRSTRKGSLSSSGQWAEIELLCHLRYLDALFFSKEGVLQFSKRKQCLSYYRRLFRQTSSFLCWSWMAQKSRSLVFWFSFFSQEVALQQ